MKLRYIIWTICLIPLLALGAVWIEGLVLKDSYPDIKNCPFTFEPVHTNSTHCGGIYNPCIVGYTCPIE